MYGMFELRVFKNFEYLWWIDVEKNVIENVVKDR